MVIFSAVDKNSRMIVTYLGSFYEKRQKTVLEKICSILEKLTLVIPSKMFANRSRSAVGTKRCVFSIQTLDKGVTLLDSIALLTKIQYLFWQFASSGDAARERPYVLLDGAENSVFKIFNV